MRSGLVGVDRTQMLAITQDVFAAMVDGGEVLVSARFGAVPEVVDPVAAWVDMSVPSLGFGARAVVRTDRPTADVLTRALLMMGDDEHVGLDDFIDAFGELANVVGGNVKSLLSVPAVLSLPTVSGQAPVMEDNQFIQDIALDWRGHVFVIELWMLVLEPVA
ncbi:chemotaxis protein CheX [Sanguibacter suaedae]|uniref:Chemotaxis protein CheX n=1 Tax=Sanguibacter suaedae TaxID=2795737 RepID=A0A934I3K7_9MICO|nr:chemotaxis protein CheX [Sanguibacter suaedae]MBI9114603.1 chemotaxis protein CheX [Sanguibacter suaedae]